VSQGIRGQHSIGCNVGWVVEGRVAEKEREEERQELFSRPMLEIKSAIRDCIDKS
jgi:hypothetical protein